MSAFTRGARAEVALLDLDAEAWLAKPATRLPAPPSRGPELLLLVRRMVGGLGAVV
jgi:hypothetical protein